MKKLLKRLVPKSIQQWYYLAMSWYAAWRYHYPSNRLIVIGVTGTKGKSTTANLIWQLLTSAGYKVGLASTVQFRIGDQHWLNTTKMTMLGRTQLQKLLSDMVAAGCTHAVVETSSEGIKQLRHKFINYDVAVFTNLYPEHLEAHGGFENYKQAKLELFRHISQSPLKVQNEQTITKAVVINGNSEFAAEFVDVSTVSTRLVWASTPQPALPVNVFVTNPRSVPNGLEFKIGSYQFTSSLLGEWNLDNIVSAVCVGIYSGLAYPNLVAAVQRFQSAPGRMEFIQGHQPFTVIVDYAHEPTSLSLLYQFWRKHVVDGHKLITLISSTGGGRDTARRAKNGQTAGELCDYVIVTDEDPYDDNPEQIMQQVLAGVLQTGKVDGVTVWKISDRRAAIEAACTLAKPGDVVILPAKGAEQVMCVAKGKKIPWDDRTIAAAILQQLYP